MTLRAFFLDLIGIGVHPPVPQRNDTLHDLRTAATLALAAHRFSGRAANETLGALAEQHRADDRPRKIHAEADRMREALGSAMRRMR